MTKPKTKDEILQSIDNKTHAVAEAMTVEDLNNLEWAVCAIEKIALEAGLEKTDELSATVSNFYGLITDDKLVEFMEARDEERED